MKTTINEHTCKDLTIKTIEVNNGNGLIVTLCNMGASIFSVLHKGKNNNLYQEMTLNYPTVEHLIENPYYFGVTIGRVAGRIAKGLMTINGLQYQLDINNNNNCLHGGYKGYSHRIWTVQVIEREQEVEVIFSLDSMDKEGGFPGNVLIQAVYLIRKSDEIQVVYKGQVLETGYETPINMTNHTYWNLSGDFNQTTIHNHSLIINASNIVQLNASIPTGQLLSLNGHLMDFRQNSRLADNKRLQAPEGEEGQEGVGIDDPFVIDEEAKGGMVACLSCDNRQLQVFSDQNSCVVYTGNYLKGEEKEKEKEKERVKRHGGVCLEMQQMPNAINMRGEEGWPVDNVIYNHQTPYTHQTTFRFI